MRARVLSVAALAVVGMFLFALQVVTAPVASAVSCTDANHKHVEAEPGGGGGYQGQGIAATGYDGMYVAPSEDTPCVRVSSTGNVNADGDSVEVGWNIDGIGNCAVPSTRPERLVTKTVSGTFSCWSDNLTLSVDWWHVWENKEAGNQTWDFWENITGIHFLHSMNTNMSHGVPYTLGERWLSGPSAFAHFKGADFYNGSTWSNWSVWGKPVCSFDDDPNFDNGFGNGAEDFRVHQVTNDTSC